MHKSKENSVSLLLPIDVVIEDKFFVDVNNKVVPTSEWMDIDLESTHIYMSRGNKRMSLNL